MNCHGSCDFHCVMPYVKLTAPVANTKAINPRDSCDMPFIRESPCRERCTGDSKLHNPTGRCVAHYYQELSRLSHPSYQPALCAKMSPASRLKPQCQTFCLTVQKGQQGRKLEN